MALPLYNNNAASTLASGASAVATSLTFTTGGGAKFGIPWSGTWQMLTLTSGANVEIVKMTARSGDVATVVRAQEGTTAQVWAAATVVEARLTAGMLNKTMTNMGTGLGAIALGAGFGSGQFPIASGNHAVAIHESASATGQSSAAVGINANATGEGANALGAYSKAMAFYASALGSGSEAHKQFAASVGYAKARAENSTAIGYDASTFARNTVGLGPWPAVQRYEYGNFGMPAAQAAVGAPFCASMHWMDLGNVPPWQTATPYTDGDVVRPTTPNGWQYYLNVYDYDTTTGIEVTTVQGEATEPAWWPTTAGDSTGTNDAWDLGDWVAVDMGAANLLAVPADVLLVVDEIIFICYKYANVTAAPFVSIGTTALPTSLVNNQQLTSITGAMQVHRFALTNAVVAADIRFLLVTAATGTNSQFHGRFVVRGMAIQKQG